MRKPWEVASGAGLLILGLFLLPGGILVIMSKLTGAEPTASIGAGIAMTLGGAWMLGTGYYLALTFPKTDKDTE